MFSQVTSLDATMVTKHSAKALEMSETVNRLESLTDRRIGVIFKIALFGLTIAVLNTLLLYNAKPEALHTFVLPNIKALIIALAAILGTTVGLIYGFSSLLTRTTRPTTALKKSVVRAYQQALDQSSFNPHPLNKQHEQLNT